MRAPWLSMFIAGVLSTPSIVAAQELPLSVLPPDAVVRQTLHNMPQLRASAIQTDLAIVGKSRLDAGSYEWTMRAGGNRRTDQNGERFNEQELALERPLRWFGKAAKDRVIGDKGVLIAQLGYADTWHETSRMLLADWFGLLREMAAVVRLTEQASLTAQLRDIAAKRVKAGDAAQLEFLQTDTENRRVGALLLQAQARQEQALQLLTAQYPGLSQPSVQRLPLPQRSNQSAVFWLEKIMQDNHELSLAQADADLSSLQASRIASDDMPDPAIGVRASRERNGQERVIGVSIAFALPGATRRTDSSSAALKATLALEKLAQTRIKVMSGAQRVVTESQRSHDIWQTMHQIQQQSQQQALTMMSAYRLGEASLGDALTTRRQAMEAALAAESAQIDALAAFARLQLDAHVIWSLD